LLWFRLDLRFDDNPALLAAADRNAPVIPVFIWAPDEEEPWPPGATSRWWLHQSLSRLSERLASIGSRLIFRYGPTLSTLQQLIAETGAQAVFWNRRYEPSVVARDMQIKKALQEQGISVETFNGSLLHEPWTIRSKGGQQPYQVFTAFWKTCLSQPEPPAAANAPKQIPVPAEWPESLDITAFHLEPRTNWASGFELVWRPGEHGARAELNSFLQHRLNRYSHERDIPDRPGTSHLSPHLHFGEISPRRIWHALQKAPNQENTDAIDSYLRELGWREFAYHLLFHFPKTPNQPLRAEFAKFPWREDAAMLKKWQRGKTGYPLVDAGMRELWTTGWMHNRVRLVTASFLTKHLRMNWEEGAYWFWDTLVDADLANNTLGWQWSAGSGADAAPYFRIFNPMKQSERFDPDGNYIRHWVPELKGLASLWIHAPWTAPPDVLKQAGIQLGNTYPFPMVEHESARREALSAFESIRR
jgi:deoxyribodipyrimidine photo-lyase